MAADRRHQQSAGHALPSKDTDDDIAPQNYGSDLSKARDLYDTVNKALTTTVNGEFFEGSKSSNANRHRQLPEIFQLRDKIEGLVESVAKKERLIAEQERIKSEGPSKPAVSSATIQAMVQSAVEQQLTKELRDLKIKNERLEERLQKIEDRRPATIDGAKKIKKPPPPCQDDVKTLQRKVAIQEFQINESISEIPMLKKENADLDFQVSALRYQANSNGMNVGKLKTRVSTVEQQISITPDDTSDHGIDKVISEEEKRVQCASQ